MFELVVPEKPIAIPRGQAYAVKIDGKVIWPPCKAAKEEKNPDMNEEE